MAALSCLTTKLNLTPDTGVGVCGELKDVLLPVQRRNKLKTRTISSGFVLWRIKRIISSGGAFSVKTTPTSCNETGRLPFLASKI